MKNWKYFISLALLFSSLLDSKNASAQTLIAYISQHGLRGEITFQQFNNTHIVVKTELQPTLQYPHQVWQLSVYEFPVDYTNIDENRCDLKNLGEKTAIFREDVDYLVIPENSTTTWYQRAQLLGSNGIWGKSLVLTNMNSSVRICATVTVAIGEASSEHMAEARFSAPIAGAVFFRWLAPANGNTGDNIIYADIFHVQTESIDVAHMLPATSHRWKIFVTDILENDRHHAGKNCNFLQLIFDPYGVGTGNGIGDLDIRLGAIRVSKDPFKFRQRLVFRDDNLVSLYANFTTPNRHLYLVLFEERQPGNILACTRIRPMKAFHYKAFINHDGISGEIAFSQRSKFDPTFINFTWGSQEIDNNRYLNFFRDVAAVKINALPPAPQKLGEPDFCYSTGTIFNPVGLNETLKPPAKYGTQDQYAVGDLYGKLSTHSRSFHHQYTIRGLSSQLSGVHWDTYLPLQGANSIGHRSVVVYIYNRTVPTSIAEEMWTCSTISLYESIGGHQKTMISAEVLFRYPIVGRLLFRQCADEPWQDTAILFEYLVHADGSNTNTTYNHRWAIHVNPPTDDFYSWKDRCLSAGVTYNPFKVYLGSVDETSYCKTVKQTDLAALCSIGSLGARSGMLIIAGNKKEADVLTRRLYIDTNIPLSGKQSVIGKSLVIFDDIGPKARGERLACSSIMRLFPRKAVAKDWHSNSNEDSVKGKFEITQQSEYDITNVEVHLSQLRANRRYFIHLNPVDAGLAFPCKSTSLGGRFNPLGRSPKLHPAPMYGSVDQYELGDIIGKFGSLDYRNQYANAFNDSHLPLFGYNSIIGRSVVVYSKARNKPSSCSTLERGYSLNEAREVRAIASFHRPEGYAYGYVRMSQLIGTDGSQSETTIEVNLKHPGLNDRNMTKTHNWQIFVNPVGVDATVKSATTRCVAAGYVWNPFYTQLADPLNRELYEKECGPHNPLRCYSGDVGSRLGAIDIGGARKILTDPNLSLDGAISAMGRSVVIFNAEHPNQKYACANIEPDYEILKYVNLEKPPVFSLSAFLEELRYVMNVPEWMLDVDARKTKNLHSGQCFQMIVYFRGPIAHQLELDMSRLLATGRLDPPSLRFPSYPNTKRKSTMSYRVCGVRDPSDSRKFNNKC